MRAFVYKNVEYRSMAQCCKSLQISYQKVRRLCRHYVRASKNPALAVAWCTGEQRLSVFETKTWKYQQDLEKNLERNEKFREKMEKSLLNRL